MSNNKTVGLQLKRRRNSAPDTKQFEITGRATSRTPLPGGVIEVVIESSSGSSDKEKKKCVTGF